MDLSYLSWERPWLRAGPLAAVLSSGAPDLRKLKPSVSRQAQEDHAFFLFGSHSLVTCIYDMHFPAQTSARLSVLELELLATKPQRKTCDPAIVCNSCNPPDPVFPALPSGSPLQTLPDYYDS
jgi:hypothetical protein